MTLPFHTPLSAAQQRQAGLDAPQPLAVADQVRFSELDVLNHVNNAVYMSWFESLRIRYTQLWGISTYTGAPDDPRIVLHSAAIRYVQELKMGEDYIATCRCTQFRTTSYSVAQQLWAGGTLRATFEAVLVLLEPDGNDKRPIPEAVRAKFVAVDGAASQQ